MILNSPNVFLGTGKMYEMNWSRLGETTLMILHFTNSETLDLHIEVLEGDIDLSEKLAWTGIV